MSRTLILCLQFPIVTTTLWGQLAGKTMTVLPRSSLLYCNAMFVSQSPTFPLQHRDNVNVNSQHISSLQCYSCLSDILVKNELCIPLERGSNVLSTGEGFICLTPTSKLKTAVHFCSIYKKTISFSAIVF